MQSTNEFASNKQEESSPFETASEKEFHFDLEELDGNRAMMLVSPSMLALVSPACATCSSQMA
jgi:hypothetical protein